jgi:hypothetical protein
VIIPLLHYSSTVCARFTMACARNKLKMVKLCLTWLWFLLTSMLIAYEKCIAVCISFSLL